MDLSAFGDDHFDAKEWINNAFKIPEASTNKDAFATTLIMKLQLFIQELNNSLEDLSQQVLQNLPRVIRDAESLYHEAKTLQEQMRTVKEDIVNVERNTAQSMQILVKIDTVKSRILLAKKALQEADNWTTLAANVEDMFQSGDVNAIAEKLVSMQQSLQILVDVSDYNERAAYLENLKNRLEAMLSPQLIIAFNTQSTDAALVYTTIFSDIKRLPELLKYYHKCHKSQLLGQWKSTVESDPEETILEWITNYYDILLSTWHSQVKWCTAVFSDVPPIGILSEVYTDVLNNLDPSISFCIQAALKQQDSELLYLIELKQISERFAKSLEVAIQAYGSNFVTAESTVALVKAIFSPYQTHIEKYPNYEENFLDSNLKDVKMDDDDIVDSIHLLGGSISKVFAFASEANTRCINFTDGCLFFGLASALKGFFSSYANSFVKILDQLKKSPSNQSSNTSLCEDWTLIQNILSFNQICGEFYMQVEELDQLLIANQISTAKKGNFFTATDDKSDVNPFQAPIKLILNSSDQTNLSLTILKLQQSDEELTLLSQVKQMVAKLCDKVVKSTFELVFSQIRAYLSSVPDMKVWQDESSGFALKSVDLPTFSISPLEYVTQIGQYLMTLPQHIEPFLLQENSALKTIFKLTKFPYVVEQADPEQLEHTADFLLSCIAQGTLQIYVEMILKIKELTQHSTKQLATDIDYLCNVLDDLGLKPISSLQSLAALLKATPQDFNNVSEGIQPQLVQAVRNMRGIHLK